MLTTHLSTTAFPVDIIAAQKGDDEFMPSLCESFKGSYGGVAMDGEDFTTLAGRVPAQRIVVTNVNLDYSRDYRKMVMLHVNRKAKLVRDSPAIQEEIRQKGPLKGAVVVDVNGVTDQLEMAYTINAQGDVRIMDEVNFEKVQRRLTGK